MYEYSISFYGLPVRYDKTNNYVFVGRVPIESDPNQSKDDREAIAQTWLKSLQRATDDNLSIIIGNRVVNPKHFLWIKAVVEAHRG